MKPEQFTKQLEQIAINVQRFADNEAPVIAGKTAADFFTANFDRQGFLNKSLKMWQDVRRRTHPRNTPKGQTSAGRRILFGETRNLSRSIDYATGTAGKVIIYTDVKYAPYHNKGTAKLPKRQFIGDSVSSISKRIN
jgi:hypothetical protein